jgi:hypothetical protein
LREEKEKITKKKERSIATNYTAKADMPNCTFKRHCCASSYLVGGYFFMLRDATGVRKRVGWSIPFSFLYLFSQIPHFLSWLNNEKIIMKIQKKPL